MEGLYLKGEDERYQRFLCKQIAVGICHIPKYAVHCLRKPRSDRVP